MATLDTTKLTTSTTGHVYYADVDTPPFVLDEFSFNPASTPSGWTWLGDTSAENLIEFKTDGGDVTYKSTWDRPNVRSVRATETITATINSVNVGRDTFLVGFGGSVHDDATKSTKVGMSATSNSKALFVVIEDGDDVAAMYLPNTDVKASFPKLDKADFAEIPLSAAILGSNTQTAGASGSLGWQWFEPRSRTTGK